MKMVPVYESNGMIVRHIERSEARKLVASGSFVWWDGCRSIRASKMEQAKPSGEAKRIKQISIQPRQIECQGGLCSPR